MRDSRARFYDRYYEPYAAAREEEVARKRAAASRS